MRVHPSGLVFALTLVACSADTSQFVPADALVHRLQRPDPERVVIDLRGGAAFIHGHVPGAVYLDVDALRSEVDGVRDQLVPREALAPALAAIGVDVGDEIVVVDESSSPHAARLVWTLASFGHPPERLQVLDGGWPAWLAAGGPTSTGVSAGPVPGATPLGGEQPALRVDADWVLAHLHDPAVLLLDVRSDEEWRVGHIPGARHLPWQRARTDAGRLLAPAVLRSLYAEALAAPTVAVYCKSGMRASLTWLVLRTLGHPDVRLYDGSWNEWGSRAELPREL